MKNKHFLILGLVFITLSSGCARMTLRKDLGDSNVANINAQTINPEAGKEPVLQTLDGQKAQNVINAYHSQKSSASKERLLDNLN